MFSEPVRRARMERARDTGEPSLAVEALGQMFEGALTLTVIAKSALFSSPILLNGAKSAAERLGLDPSALHDLPVKGAKHVLACTSGDLASQVERLVKAGGGGLANALSVWMPIGLAQRLEDDALDGKILLWVRIFSTEDEAEICETILANVPQRIEVLDLVPVAKAG